MNICEKIKNFFRPPNPTPDEELVAEIKSTLLNLKELGKRAKDKGITVYLKEHYTNGDARNYCIVPDRLSFESARKFKTTVLG